MEVRYYMSGEYLGGIEMEKIRLNVRSGKILAPDDIAARKIMSVKAKEELRDIVRIHKDISKNIPVRIGTYQRIVTEDGICWTVDVYTDDAKDVIIIRIG